MSISIVDWFHWLWLAWWPWWSKVYYRLCIHYWFRNLLHGLVRNKVPSLFLRHKQSIVVQSKPARKPCGFVRSCLNLVFISSIQLHFGVIIRVSFSYVKIQFSISIWNTLNSTYTYRKAHSWSCSWSAVLSNQWSSSRYLYKGSHRSEVYQTSIHAWSSGKLSLSGDRL